MTKASSARVKAVRRPIRRRAKPRPGEAGELVSLRRRLAEAEDALRAIREGEVDAVIVSGSKGERIFSLRESESIYRLMVETMSEAGLAVTPEGIILFANDCFARMVRKPLEQVAGKPLAQCVSLDSRRRLSSLLARARRGPTEARIVLETGGASIPVHVWANLLDRPDGAMICLVGVDLSQLETSKEMIQHLQEQRQVLAESEAALKKAQKLAHIGSWTWEIQKRRFQPSEEMERIFGMGREEFGRDATDLIDHVIHPGDRERVRAAIRASAKNGPGSPMEFRIVRPDGSHRTVWGEVGALGRDSEGNPEIMTGVIQDITERKAAEEVLRRSAEELEELVRQRTAEIEKRDDLIRRAQKIEALGTLAGGIAHDFNNVLSTIMINSELALLDAEDGGAGKGQLSLLLQAAQRGQELVKQIITFSRQKEQERTPLRISPIIKEALRFLRSSLPSSIEIRESLEESFDSALADPSQISQILTNLCVNAAYAMRERGGILKVELKALDIEREMSAEHPELQPGPYICLIVSDTGCGMTPDVADRVFDPFFTTKPPGEGSGLGLSVVYGIVKSYGGGIAVCSEPGQGSKFSVFMPRIKAPKE
ncbi:MAG TPA: ATP-binding protein, partial [Acidobacteriota bacterium]|nr:ATP-binding protein [Acidobacteriota bacterium]